MTARVEPFRRARTAAPIGARWLLFGLSLWSLPAAGPRAVAQQEAAPPAGQAAPYKPYPSDAQLCQRCHTHPEDYVNRDPPALCDMTEYHTWAGKDKHRIAFKVLTDERARRMGEVLGIDVRHSGACTNCHASPLNQPVADAPRRDRLQAENGVACVSCHGDNRAWIEKHQEPPTVNPEWDGLSRRQKEDRYGMTDLWDPVRRAETCASCHVGRVDRQRPAASKVVTHAMYAAGHPMLPSLETATFSEFQPRHWKYLREKPPGIRRRQNDRDGQHEQAALVAASGVVAFRAVMDLFAEQAAGEGVVQAPATAWPDFARYDCLACHHELRRPSWRQERTAPLPPGRPGLPAWSRALLRLGVEAADPARAHARWSELEQTSGALDRALAAQPFGARDPAVAAARALVAWADEVSRDLSAARVGPQEARRLLLVLGAEAQTTWDYDAARQVAWAFGIVYREMTDPSDPAVERALKGLEPLLALRLEPAGQAPIEAALGQRLRAVADYRPDAFHRQFAVLAERLSRMSNAP